MFGNPEALAKLNAITHPKIAALGMRRLIELQQSAAPYLLYEAAILVEQGTHKNFAGLIVVRVDESVQLARLMARDNAGEADARARIARGEKPLGYKIGFTNRSIWDRYGVHQPIWGPVWDTTLSFCDGEAQLSLAGTCQPRLEPEAVFEVANDAWQLSDAAA